jgi:hypothetical protein
MSRLAELQTELQDTAAAIAHAERTLAANPNVPSVLATLRTISKRRENLEADFQAAANALGLDVCSYRIELADDARPTIAGLTAVLSEFQKVFTNVFNALKNGPRLTSKVSADVANETAFGFAYTFPGSVGVVMTLENERLLIGKTDLDDAMATTLALLSAKRRSELQNLAEKTGLPALRHAHQWALENSRAGFGADIVWQRADEIRQEARVQPQESAQLAAVIGDVTAKEQVTVIGELRTVDLIEKSFRMGLKDRVIQGSFANAISAAHPAELPRIYQATMTVSQRVVVSEGQEDVSYFLLRLEPVDSSTALLSDFSKL